MSGPDPSPGAGPTWSAARAATAGDELERALLVRTLGEVAVLCRSLGSEEAEDLSRRLGWLVGVLASSAQLDFLRARRESDGLVSALELVVQELRSRGVDVTLRGPQPRVMGGPREHWRLPAALMRYAWHAGLGRSNCVIAFSARPVGVTCRVTPTGGPSPLDVADAEVSREVEALAPGLQITQTPEGWECDLPAGWVELRSGATWSG